MILRDLIISDSTTPLIRGPFANTRGYGVLATGNQSFGYFGGDYGPLKSTVERLDYSNDTATLGVKGPLSVARGLGAATGNANFGYFAGGFIPDRSTVDRIDYSNDTATASPKGPLSDTRRNIGATGNVSFAYIGGGPGTRSTVDRIDYSNDTATAVQKGPFSISNKDGTTATSAAEYGLPQ